MRYLVSGMILMVSAPHLGAQVPSRQDSTDVAAVVERFHGALARGDSLGALELLADDVVVLESGASETKADYRAHHLQADIAFAGAVPAQAGPLSVSVRGDVAWASRTRTTQGEYRGRAVNSASAELIVLTRESEGWRIRAIHWSSRARRPAQSPEEEVRAAVDRYNKALVAKDLPALKGLLADDIVLYEHSVRNIGLDDVWEHHLRPEVEAFQDTKASFTDERVWVLGDLALVTRQYAIQARMNDRPIDARGNETMGWIRRNGQWKVVHIHYSHPCPRATGSDQ